LRAKLIFSLPPLLVLTDRRRCLAGDLLEVVRLSVSGGAEAIVLREKDLPRPDRADLAEQIRAIAPVVIVASDPAIPAAGLHLAARDEFPAHRPGLVGRSCHSATDIAAAAGEGCDYVTLSPVFPTSSKPGYGPALGVGSLGGHPIPVYALGGVSAVNAAACSAAGAAGVAVMGEIMGAADPVAVTRLILAELAR
jgi:thiamine-phosphate pyrophosphorylase